MDKTSDRISYTTQNPKIKEYKDLVKIYKSIHAPQIVLFKKMYGWDAMLMQYIRDFEGKWDAERFTRKR